MSDAEQTLVVTKYLEKGTTMLSETSGDWVITKANSRAAKIAKDKADVKQKENDKAAC